MRDGFSDRRRSRLSFSQALPHLPVRIPQPVEQVPSENLAVADRQVAGLEQQRLRGDLPHIESAQQRVVGDHLIEVEGTHAPPHQGVHQKPRRPGLEPVRLELPAAEQHGPEASVRPLRGDTGDPRRPGSAGLLPARPAKRETPGSSWGTGTRTGGRTRPRRIRLRGPGAARRADHDSRRRRRDAVVPPCGGAPQRPGCG